VSARGGSRNSSGTAPLVGRSGSEFPTAPACRASPRAAVSAACSGSVVLGAALRTRAADLSGARSSAYRAIHLRLVGCRERLPTETTTPRGATAGAPSQRGAADSRITSNRSRSGGTARGSRRRRRSRRAPRRGRRSRRRPSRGLRRVGELDGPSAPTPAAAPVTSDAGRAAAARRRAPAPQSGPPRAGWRRPPGSPRRSAARTGVSTARARLRRPSPASRPRGFPRPGRSRSAAGGATTPAISRPGALPAGAARGAAGSDRARAWSRPWSPPPRFDRTCEHRTGRSVTETRRRCCVIPRRLLPYRYVTVSYRF
jgi:hypothetical protein